MNAEDLVLNFKRDMANLSKTERRRAIESVRDVIRAAAFDDAAGSAYEIERCPRCGSVAVVKKGKSRNGEQRYLCRGCGRTFGTGSGRILGTSRLPRETWMAYAECFVLMLPLRECARRCRVCLKTAYTMRHRLIECLSAYSPSFRVERGCGCELDETYFPESFKGNHAKGSFAMPRPSRHRGKQVHRRGLSRERICVMTGVNDSNELFLEVTGRGALSRGRAMDALRGRIASGSVVATDRAAAYVNVLAELEVAAHEAYDPKDRTEGTINRINAVHSLLDSFMARFRGVSTKHLGAYLDWFRWCRTFMATDSRTAESTVARQLASGSCGIRVRDMFNVPPPYMDYWAAPAA
ncbi:IS1595 family transposase [Collinsella aerofaciens]|uniref:IS1595 family transposase n=1 Tax=Collinsella aerofaciens TaxID=74426 RepID=UPI00325B5A91